MTLLWVALGGALGTVSRYGLSTWVSNRAGSGPLGIFVVNVTGAFLIGLILVATENRFDIPVDARRFLAVGVLGGYTTFSTLAYDTMTFVEAGDYLRATLNSAGSIAAGLVAVSLGMACARVL